MQHRIIMTAAISNWEDGDCHATIVIGGLHADGQNAEDTIALELPPLADVKDLRLYARRALASLLAEL